MNGPDWWVTLLLTAAAYRLWRGLMYDVILDKPRTWVLNHLEGTRYDYWLGFVLCPFCSGFWTTGVVLAVYCAVEGWFGWLAFATYWLAMSLGVGLIGSKVDT